MKDGRNLGPQERGSDQFFCREKGKPVGRQRRLHGSARIDVERHQRPVRERRTARTTSGMLSPVLVLLQGVGKGSRSPPRRFFTSSSSTTCCVPTLRARNRPDRIHRRTVSGSRPTLTATS